jgi:hypothetical protein
MKSDHVAYYYKREEISDVDLLIVLQPQAPNETGCCSDQKQSSTNSSSSNDAPGSASVLEEEVLRQFPAHQLVLFAADYFKAQVITAVFRQAMHSMDAASVTCGTLAALLLAVQQHDVIIVPALCCMSKPPNRQPSMWPHLCTPLSLFDSRCCMDAVARTAGKQGMAGHQTPAGKGCRSCYSAQPPAAASAYQ